MLPHYLAKKLLVYGITNTDQLKQHDIFRVFKWLKYDYPSISDNALYDLYALINNFSFKSIDKEIKAQIKNILKSTPPSYPPLAQNTIDLYLDQAQQQANLALDANEVPIGAVVVYNNQVIATGYNQTIHANNILKHAEIVALENAQAHLNNFRLDGCDLYVTIEPCVMCCGAILNSRIKRVIFGASEPKTGAVFSQYLIFNNPNLNHHTEAIGPINNSYYSSLLQQFFKQKRNNKYLI